MSQAIRGVTAPAPAAVRRKRFKAEMDGLRERMRALGFGFDETAARSGRQPRLGSGHQQENVTFKSIVGLELMAPGLDVERAVYCDETVFDTFAEIIATVPGQGDGGGQVCVADDGGLTWTRDYLAEAAAPSGPGLCGQAADPASIAGSVVEAVTRAMSLLRPAEAGRAGHG